MKAAQIPEWVSVDAGQAVGLRPLRAGARADAARVQRAARRRVLLALSRSQISFMIELETPQRRSPLTAIEEVEADGNLAAFEVNPAGRWLRRHAGQRPASRPAELPRGSGRHLASRSPASSTSSARSTNVKEDVTQIVLNIKKLRLRSFARHPDHPEAGEARRRPRHRRRHRRVGRRRDREPGARPAHARLATPARSRWT